MVTPEINLPAIYLPNNSQMNTELGLSGPALLTYSQWENLLHLIYIDSCSILCHKRSAAYLNPNSRLAPWKWAVPTNGGTAVFLFVDGVHVPLFGSFFLARQPSLWTKDICRWHCIVFISIGVGSFEVLKNHFLEFVVHFPSICLGNGKDTFQTNENRNRNVFPKYRILTPG